MALARSVAIIAVISLGTYVYHQMSVTVSAPYHAFTAPSSVETRPHTFDYASMTTKELVAKEPLSNAQLIVEWLANQDTHAADTHTTQPLLLPAHPPLPLSQSMTTPTTVSAKVEANGDSDRALRKFKRSTLASPASSSEFPPLKTPNTNTSATIRFPAATSAALQSAPKLPPPPVLTGAARPYLKVTPQDLKAFTYHVMVSKPHKLVMFTIPKVSCTEFIRLFFRLKGDRQWAADPHFRKGKPLLKDLPLEEVEAIMNDPTWTKAVFFRDPAKRLLSAYLDKFVKNRDYSVTVFNQARRAPKFAYRTFASLVANCTGDDACGGPRKRYTPLGLHARTNPHWKPQVYMCSLHKFLPTLNFVGSFDYLAAHTELLLTGLGLWEQYGASGWGKDRQEAMFQSNRAVHQTGSAKASARQQHSDPALERLVRRAYWQDYAVLELLGIATPQSGPHRHQADDKKAEEEEEEEEEEKGSVTGGVSDHLFREALSDQKSASSSVDASHDAAAEHQKPGPFGGAFGDGANRDQGSYASKPPPRVVPMHEFSSKPVFGERWDLQSMIAGFGPSYGP